MDKYSFKEYIYQKFTFANNETKKWVDFSNKKMFFATITIQIIGLTLLLFTGQVQMLADELILRIVAVLSGVIFLGIIYVVNFVKSPYALWREKSIELSLYKTDDFKLEIVPEAMPQRTPEKWTGLRITNKSQEKIYRCYFVFESLKKSNEKIELLENKDEIAWSSKNAPIAEKKDFDRNDDLVMDIAHSIHANNLFQLTTWLDPRWRRSFGRGSYDVVIKFVGAYKQSRVEKLFLVSLVYGGDFDLTINSVYALESQVLLTPAT